MTDAHTTQERIYVCSWGSSITSPEAMEDMFDITEESNGPAPNLPPKIEMNHLQR
jgi:hypothetical protein